MDRFGYNQSYSGMSQGNPVHLARTSFIVDHNPHQKTDKLYDPLRHLILVETPIETDKTAQIGRKSFLRNPVKPLTEAERKVLRNSIYIPVQDQLVESYSLVRINKTQFRVAMAEQFYGAPISAEALQQKLSKISTQPVQVFYMPRSSVFSDQKVAAKTKAPTKSIDKVKSIFRSYKYNAFSSLDQPANTGCTPCGCSPNECIAPKINNSEIDNQSVL